MPRSKRMTRGELVKSISCNCCCCEENKNKVVSGYTTTLSDIAIKHGVIKGNFGRDRGLKGFLFSSEQDKQAFVEDAKKYLNSCNLPFKLCYWISIEKWVGIWRPSSPGEYSKPGDW
jgi:hypothetical protein